MKPGWKTTEFWLMIAASVAVTVQAMLPVGTPAEKITTAIVAGLAALGYTAARTMIKVADD